MKIVIDIPEDVYTRLFDNGIQDNEIAVDDVCEMARALRHGTPLPDHHGDLIDKNKLTFNCMADVDCDHKNCNTCQYKCVAKYEIENAIVLKKQRGVIANEIDS